MNILGLLVDASDFVEHHIGAFTAVLAGAAIFQWRETRITAERQLRAYILNSTASLYDGSSMPNTIVDRTDQPGFIVEIKNFGLTPAYKVAHWTQIDVVMVNRERDIRPQVPLDNTHLNVIGPGQISSKPRWLDRSLSLQEINGIKSGSYAIYVYGRIEYVDAFKNKRWSNYKLRYTGSAWPPVGGQTTMTFCAEGNEAN